MTSTGLMESGFHASIDAAPDDRTVRLVYADWLEEGERSAEAEFWRWVSEKQRMPTTTEYGGTPGCDTRSGLSLEWTWERPTNAIGGRWVPKHAILPKSLIAAYDNLSISIPDDSSREEGGEMPLEDDFGWLWFTSSPYHAFRHLYLVWSQVLTQEERKACWEWEPPK
jgi:uncharacterized protein (TIGR02996 family)